MPQVFNIAPRVLVYPHGTVPPAVEEGWLALPQLPTATAPSSAGAATSVGSTVALVHDGAPGGGPRATPLRPSHASDVTADPFRGASAALAPVLDRDIPPAALGVAHPE